ncbi:MAG: PAS domain S-box protein [Nitrospirae bacterium]|nr:PAS domain S-box protein [Nitrospirota bacterium]
MFDEQAPGEQLLCEMQRLRESEGKFRLLLDTTGDYILTADVETGVISYCNDRFAELLGIPAAKLRGMDLYEIFPAEQREIYARRLAGGHDQHIVSDMYLRHREGRHIPVELTGQRP